jgi:hypothetical protein
LPPELLLCHKSISSKGRRQYPQEGGIASDTAISRPSPHPSFERLPAISLT